MEPKDPSQSALDEMADALASPAPEPAAEPAPEPEPEPENEPTPEPEPVSAEPAAPAEPAPASAPVVAPVEKPETDFEKAVRENNELRTLLNDMARGGGVPTSAVPAAAGGAPAVSSSPAAVPAKPVGQAVPSEVIKAFNDAMKANKEFLTKEELDNLVDHPELILKALNDTRRSTAEEVVTIMPTIVQGMVQQYFNAYRASQDFYEVNSDLNPYREYVSLVYSQVKENLKDKTPGEILKQTATEARKRLRLAEPVPVTTKQPVRKPAFAKSGGTQRQPAARTTTPAVKNQQDYMIDIL